MPYDKEIRAAIKLLEQSKDYRVLRRLPVAKRFHRGREIAAASVIGIVVDIETTGLDIDIDEVIELGMIKFVFDRNGKIGRTLTSYRSLNQPTIPIPPSITALTGISNDDVSGKSILEEDVSRFVADVGLVIAHNAAFDRPFCEKLFAGFGQLSWACSATEIDWRSEGISGSRLEYIACSFGCFYEAHRAIDDCNALLNILSFTLPRSKRVVLSSLLAAARRTNIRIFAEGAPYEARLILKRAGYRWNDGQNGYPRAWWKDVPEAEVDSELTGLAGMSTPNIVNPKLFRMNAKTRFSRQWPKGDNRSMPK